MNTREQLRQKTIAYHTRELNDMKARAEQASRGLRRKESLPEFRDGERILDIGCGAGQTLLVAANGHDSVGLDVDITALELGRTWRPDRKLVCSPAETLPFRSQSFDLVMARVSLPYTDIPLVLAEVNRVLKPEGRFWTALHSFSKMREIYLRDVNWRRWGAFGLVSFNGLALHFLHRPLCLPASRLETFQTEGGFRFLLEKNGFEQISFERDSALIVSARKSGSR